MLGGDSRMLPITQDPVSRETRRGHWRTYIDVLFVLFDAHPLLNGDPWTTDRVEVRLVRGMLNRVYLEGNSHVDVPKSGSSARRQCDAMMLTDRAPSGRVITNSASSTTTPGKAVINGTLRIF